MTGNTQLNADEARAGQIKLCENVKRSSSITVDQTNRSATSNQPPITTPDSQSNEKMDTSKLCHGERYWQMKFESLRNDYDHLHKLNQNLEEKLLNVVEVFEKKRKELVANAEYEKSTLMADVDKLSTKLVDARMKLHDREEQDVLHAAECDAPCHSKTSSSRIMSIAPTSHTSSKSDQKQQMMNDPNLV